MVISRLQLLRASPPVECWQSCRFLLLRSPRRLLALFRASLPPGRARGSCKGCEDPSLGLAPSAHSPRALPNAMAPSRAFRERPPIRRGRSPKSRPRRLTAMVSSQASTTAKAPVAFSPRCMSRTARGTALFLKSPAKASAARWRLFRRPEPSLLGTVSSARFRATRKMPAELSPRWPRVKGGPTVRLACWVGQGRRVTRAACCRPWRLSGGLGWRSRCGCTPLAGRRLPRGAAR
mmetsp:Transcript_85809/g.228731  ORF Transcript_85809/g.228731 Transcript_85809/m.228731 type:complete len:235 (-) Transcript_85809:764-1468(-)